MGSPDGLGVVAAAGDRLATLRALRDQLAQLIETAGQARDVAALSRQLVLVLGEIDRLAPPEQKGNPLDELNSRRAARGAAPARQSRPAR